MLEKSDKSVSETLKVFNKHNLAVALLVPTDTAMKKSIMDATSQVREYLSEVGFHDYDTQAQGPEAKVTRTAYFVGPDGLEESTVSLYRPQTKNGDPRIWFGLLGRYAQPFNLLAVIAEGERLYVVNCSNEATIASINNPASPLGELAARLRPKEDPAVSELLEMIREISGRGYIRTLRPGDTGIGMTLETLLGIAANPNQAPDYKGIELKSKRIRRGRGNRTNLFSQVPNWRLSPVGSAYNLLSLRGVEVDGRRQLYHELNAKAPNSYGLLLEVDAGQDWLKQNHFDRETEVTTHDATWELETLRQRLVEKHRQTFWVSARCRGRGEEEEFHYIQVEHTKQPRVANFDALIESGVVSLDYTMSEKPGNRVRDHGYLFKIHPNDFEALFPPSELHEFA